MPPPIADAPFILQAADALLPNARVAAVSGGLLVLTDNGPGADLEWLLDQADLILANLPDLAAQLQAQYLAQAVLTANGDLLTLAAGSPASLPIGSTGDILTVASGLPAWAPPPTLGLPPPGLPPISGQFYGQPQTDATATTVSSGTNTLFLVPIFLPYTTAIASLRGRQQSSGAANYRIGVYGPITTSITGVPLLFESGVIALGGAADITLVVSTTLDAGWYLAALVSDTARTLFARPLANTLVLAGWPNLTTTQAPTHFQVAHTFGALPSPSPSGLSLVASAVPNLSVEAA